MPSSHIYTLSLHDALPILLENMPAYLTNLQDQVLWLDNWLAQFGLGGGASTLQTEASRQFASVGTAFIGDLVRLLTQVATSALDRKSTRLNSSHSQISYAVLPHLHSFPTRRSSDLAREHARIPDQPAGPGVVARQLARPVWPGRRREHPSDGGEPPVRQRRHRVHRRPGAAAHAGGHQRVRSEEHTSELQSQSNLVCRPPTSTLFPYTTLFRSCSRTCPHT